MNGCVSVAMSAAQWRLYGVPLSQPFRSVAWAMLQNQIRFDVQIAVPGAANKVGSRHEAYRALSRMRGTEYPLLEDTRTGFTVAESPAILAYLCDYYGWSSLDDSLYAPAGSTKRATIDSYMHWHHTGTRKLSSFVFPYLRPSDSSGSAPLNKNDEKERQKLAETLLTLEEGWFASLAVDSNASRDHFLVGGPIPPLLICWPTKKSCNSPCWVSFRTMSSAQSTPRYMPGLCGWPNCLITNKSMYPWRYWEMSRILPTIFR